MAEKFPFEMKMNSVEEGYETAMCIICYNRDGPVKYDGLVYK